MRQPLLSRMAGAALLLAAALTLPPSSGAQELANRAVARTGLYTINRGHTAHVHLVDVGDPRDTSSTQVVLKLIDDRNRVVGRLEGVLRPGSSLRLAHAIPLGGNRNRSPLVVRAEAELVTSATNLTSAPILTLELFNTRTLDSFASASCPIPYDPEGVGGRVTGYCGGCHVDVELGI